MRGGTTACDNTRAVVSVWQVILCEATGTIAFLVPMLVASVVAVYLGNHLSASIYDAVAGLGEWPLLPSLQTDEVYHLLAEDVMEPLDLQGVGNGAAPHLPVVPRLAALGELFEVLKHPFEAFNQLIMVVDTRENMLLLGAINRRELAAACIRLQERLRLAEDGRHEQRPDAGDGGSPGDSGIGARSLAPATRLVAITPEAARAHGPKAAAKPGPAPANLLSGRTIRNYEDLLAQLYGAGALRWDTCA
jgi:hypothetical protein